MPPIVKNNDSDEIARHIIEFGLEAEDFQERKAEPQVELLLDLALPWPAGLAPTPRPLDNEPASGDELPDADVVVVTWTVAENEALADVMTPGFGRNNWYRYDRNFAQYIPKIRQGAPARKVNRLGSYFPLTIGNRKVLCFKSELHLNQDGVKTGEGTATLPVKDLFHQIIRETGAKFVITVGTAGATFLEHQLGDVMITRAAKFRLSQEFAKETFAKKTYRCDTLEIPTKHLAKAQELLAKNRDKLIEPAFGPPTKNYDYDGPLIKLKERNDPDLKIDGVHFDAFHPMLTTDFFEFGNSTNNLQLEGCGVEMGDAVLGMVCEELGAAAPDWLVIRNASDPQINGDLQDRPRTLNMQAHWAVWYYETYGYWTSVNSAIATWAMIAP